MDHLLFTPHEPDDPPFVKFAEPLSLRLELPNLPFK